VLAAQSLAESGYQRPTRAVKHGPCALNSPKQPRGSENRPSSSFASPLASFSMDEVRRSQSDTYEDVILDPIGDRFCLASQMNVFVISYLIFRLWKALH